MFQINKKLLKGFDWTIVLIITILAMIGIMFIVNATASAFTGQESSFAEIWEKINLTYPSLQMMWFFLGLTLMAIVCLVDYHTYADLINIGMVVIILLLGLLLVLKVVTSATTKGIAGWFSFGDRKFQPSEVGKIVLIIYMAKFAAQAVEKDGCVRINQDFFKSMAWVVIPLVLIILQPDPGTAMVYVIIIAGILFTAKISWKLIIGAILAGGAGIVVAFFTIMKDYQKARIINFFDWNSNKMILDAVGMTPDTLKFFDNLQGESALMTVGSGGFYGKGFFKPGSLVQLKYLPESHTDFAFAAGMEAVGFLGGIIILGLFLALLLRAMYIGLKAKDNLGTFIVVGVVAMELAHITENVGMNIGLMPITGIPLPFISYGGSAMWTNMLAFGLVLNVGMRRPTKRFASP